MHYHVRCRLPSSSHRGGLPPTTAKVRYTISALRTPETACSKLSPPCYDVGKRTTHLPLAVAAVSTVVTVAVVQRTCRLCEVTHVFCKMAGYVQLYDSRKRSCCSSRASQVSVQEGHHQPLSATVCLTSLFQPLSTGASALSSCSSMMHVAISNS